MLQKHTPAARTPLARAYVVPTGLLRVPRGKPASIFDPPTPGSGLADHTLAEDQHDAAEAAAAWQHYAGPMPS